MAGATVLGGSRVRGVELLSSPLVCSTHSHPLRLRLVQCLLQLRRGLKPLSLPGLPVLPVRLSASGTEVSRARLEALSACSGVRTRNPRCHGPTPSPAHHSRTCGDRVGTRGPEEGDLPGSQRLPWLACPGSHCSWGRWPGAWWGQPPSFSFATERWGHHVHRPQHSLLSTSIPA